MPKLKKAKAKKSIKRAANGARKLPAPKYRTFRLSKRIKHVHTSKLPSVYRLTRQTFSILKSRWKLFLGLLIVYMLLTVFIVSGLGIGSDIGGLKSQIQSSAGSVGGLATSITVFEYILFNSNAAGSEAGGVYQLIILVVFSLASIWALRQVMADKEVKVKQTFYNGMYPLIPFLLVMCVIMLQLTPVFIGNFMYSIVVNGGIAVEVIEKITWGIFAALCALLSLYMISSSIFALYIVTLPDMRPMQALRSAREVVRHRRFMVMRKVLALPLVMVLLLGVIMIPLIIWAAPVAEVVFFVLSMTGLLVAHTYLYTLYRELL